MHFNQIKKNLERSSNKKIPFLDTEVKLVLNVFRKPTDANLLMQYTTVCPKA